MKVTKDMFLAKYLPIRQVAAQAWELLYATGEGWDDFPADAEMEVDERLLAALDQKIKELNDLALHIYNQMGLEYQDKRGSA